MATPQSTREALAQRTADVQKNIAMLIARRTEQFSTIQRALRALHQGSYGQCQDCGQDISFRRLAAVPWALRCTGCQETVDRLRGSDRAFGRHQVRDV